MIRIVSKSKRHYSDFGWLKTYWLFSFSNYFDPDNIQFGALRVFNDDVVQPGTGFPTHPHEEMEIVTIVLEGEMTHADSMGNRTVIRAGDVQRMSAGTGLTHSEFNLAAGAGALLPDLDFPGHRRGFARHTTRSLLCRLTGRTASCRWRPGRACRAR
ncbi:MAG: pirin family protein [Desulfobacterales bacterium]|nr:pirin family protein [Desulfobacterales bacterium]